ncbi:hypothetical protein PF010_g17542 [Phytophthora fragariae]|uniref:PiggyBac transposable element-derived protein domain-containing protein n=1 Tax=Phytophthora fragariae TaxID=53985 RepID=A0A6G0KNQ1_9STRA|nr:hypothetical protein PF010_g17542 [Phytophthora fragariae]
MPTHRNRAAPWYTKADAVGYLLLALSTRAADAASWHRSQFERELCVAFVLVLRPRPLAIFNARPLRSSTSLESTNAWRHVGQRRRRYGQRKQLNRGHAFRCSPDGTRCRLAFACRAAPVSCLSVPVPRRYGLISWPDLRDHLVAVSAR